VIARLPNKDPDALKKYRFIYHFLPHPEERKRAKLLLHKALFSYCFILIVLLGVFKFIPKHFPGILGYASNISTSALLEYTNKERVERGLNPLVINEALIKAANEKANSMFENNYWAHVSPKGIEPWDFILSSGYDYIYAGENLAKNFSNSSDVVEAWVQSPTHRENLLSENYNDIGFAVVNGVLDGYETTLVVQMFGQNRTPTVMAEVSSTDKLQAVESTVKPEPIIDMEVVTKSITILFGGFVVTLFSLDIWYSKKKSILKINGHTFAHIVFLLAIIVSVMVSMLPGAIL